MKEALFKGCPSELGEAHGRRFAAQIAQSYQTHCAEFEKDPRFPGFIQDMQDRLRQALPEAEEELLHIARGSGLLPWQIIALNYWEELAVLLDGHTAASCSSIALKSSDHGPLLGKTTDIEPQQFPDYTLQRVYPQRGYALVQMAKVGTLKAEIGMNSAGLCIGTSSSMPTDTVQEPGVERMTLVRYALQYCATVEQAIQFFEKFHFYRLGLNIVLLEKNGNAAVLEKSIGRQRLRTSGNNYLYATNFYAHPEMNAVYDHQVWYFENAFYRHVNLQKAVDNLGVADTLDSVKALLSGHAVVGSVCDHTDYGTLYASIWAPKNKKFYICTGHPCQEPFREMSF